MAYARRRYVDRFILAIHAYDSLIKLLLAALLNRLAVSLSVVDEILKLQLAILKLLTLAAVE
jgi:hypothetical protein